MDENKELLEGKETNDSLEGTSPSEEEATAKVELNSTPSPVAGEEEDGNNSGDELPTLENVESTPDLVEDAVNAPAQDVATQDASYVDQNAQESVAAAGFSEEENGVMSAPLKFTQSQVNEMVGKTRTDTRDKTFRYIYDRYGVNSEEELDNLVGNAQRFDSLKEEYDAARADWKNQSSARDLELAGVKEQVALMQSGIDSSRYEDAKFILKGKGLEVSLENIQQELATHPEWKKQDAGMMPAPNPNFVKTGEPAMPLNAEPEGRISVLGNERGSENGEHGQNEEDFAMSHYFKV